MEMINIAGHYVCACISKNTWEKRKKNPCFVAVHMKTLNDMWPFGNHTVTAEFSEMPAKLR